MPIPARNPPIARTYGAAPQTRMLLWRAPLNTLRLANRAPPRRRTESRPLTKISSSTTAFYKKGFPVLMFGSLGLFLVAMVIQYVSGRTDVSAVIYPSALAVFGYVMMRVLVWDLVDEVYYGGDFLVVKNKGKEHRVPLTDILRVSSSRATNPPRVTVKLCGASASGPLGREFTFSPPKTFSLNPFAESDIADALTRRVHDAKAARVL